MHAPRTILTPLLKTIETFETLVTGPFEDDLGIGVEEVEIRALAPGTFGAGPHLPRGEVA